MTSDDSPVGETAPKFHVSQWRALVTALLRGCSPRLRFAGDWIGGDLLVRRPSLARDANRSRLCREILDLLFLNTSGSTSEEATLVMDMLLETFAFMEARAVEENRRNG